MVRQIEHHLMYDPEGLGEGGRGGGRVEGKIYNLFLTNKKINLSQYV